MELRLGTPLARQFLTRSSGTPLDSVDLLLVSGEVMDGGVPIHAPDLQCHVVAARGEELPLWVPLDGVHLIGVALGEQGQANICTNYAAGTLPGRI